MPPEHPRGDVAYSYPGPTHRSLHLVDTMTKAKGQKAAETAPAKVKRDNPPKKRIRKLTAKAA